MKSTASALEQGETLNQSISVSYSNNKIVTLKNSGYLDMQGAAHGMPFDVAATFLKADGSQLTADILPPIARIRPLIVQGLLPYFKFHPQPSLTTA